MKAGSLIRLRFLDATSSKECFVCDGIVIDTNEDKESITVHFLDSNDTIEYYLGQFDNEIECEVLSE